MKRFWRITSGALAALVIGALFAVGVPREAWALAGPACSGSINDPKCAPVTAAIFSELGIATAGGKTAAVTAGAAGAATAPVTVNAAAHAAAGVAKLAKRCFTSWLCGATAGMFGLEGLTALIDGAFGGTATQADPDVVWSAEHDGSLWEARVVDHVMSYSGSTRWYRYACIEIKRDGEILTGTPYSNWGTVNVRVDDGRNAAGFGWQGSTGVCPGQYAARVSHYWTTSDRSGTAESIAVELCLRDAGSFADQWARCWGAPAEVATPYVDGTVRATAACKAPDGTVTSKTVQATVSVPVGSEFPVPDVICPPGEIAIETSVEFQRPDAPEWQPIGGSEAPAPVTQLPSLYPLCYASGGTAGYSWEAQCTLGLYRIGEGGSLESCGPVGNLCPEWASQPNAQSLYQCRYGPYDVDLAMCSAYRAPWVGVLPNWDPVTETYIPITAPVPEALPGTVPEAPPGTTPPAPDPFEPPIDEGGEPSQCWPTGWGVLNPASWVLQPLKCAFEWAFVPRPGYIQSKVATATSLVQSTAPVQIANVIEGWEFQAPASGCEGILIPWSTVFEGLPDFRILNACPGEPLAPWATASSWFIGISTAVTCVAALTRYFGGIVQYGGIRS